MITAAPILESVTADTNGGPVIHSVDPHMRRTWDLVHGVASTPTTVLVTGESGTGKEVVARMIHSLSPRAKRPFIAINCGAVVSSLAESELFGHEKGAFSGATERRVGVFEAADRGTLLLDEISELPLPLQAKLLRVLQEREVVRVGSTRPRPIDVRIIATSNRDLPEMVRRGEFREDLFYRLNVFPLRLSPLRARLVDLPLLAESIVKDLASSKGSSPQISQAAFEALAEHSWPGNVRELRNVVERSLVLSRDGRLTADDVRRALSLRADQIRSASHGLSPQTPEASEEETSLADLERDAILRRLARFGGNRTVASRSLGISLRTLRNKIREYRAAGFLIPESNRIHVS